MTSPIRPKYDPRIEERQGSLLDKLIGLIGKAPNSISPVPNAPWLGETRGNDIKVRDARDENALVHELGHFWSIKESPSSYELSDSLHINPGSISGNERLAETYAALLRAGNDTTQTKNKDAKLLFRIIGRQMNEGAKK